MSAALGCRIAAGVLVLLACAAVGIGGLQLWSGGPDVWPDIVASRTTVRRTSGGMLLMAVLLLIAGAATIGNAAWGGAVAAIATVIVVFGAFWANYVLFGGIRLLHTGTNVVVAAVILALLWVGRAGDAR